jgi:hypothetical protein
MIGWRVDQILASKAFEFQITGESDEVDKLLYEASILAGRKRKTKREHEKYLEIKRKIALARLSERQTESEDKIDREIATYLINEIRKNEKKIFGENNDQNITLRQTPQ